MTVTACRHRVARNGMFALFLCGAMAAPCAAARADMGKGVSGARVRLKSRTAMVDIRQVFRDVGQAVEFSVVNIEVRRIIAARGLNATVRLSVHRDGKSLDISMKLAEMPAELMAAGSREGGPDSGGTPGRIEPLRKLGIDQVTTMTRALAEQFNLEFNAGVLVPSVGSDSTADAAGLRPGQVITEVANTPVMNVESLLGEMAKYDLKVGVRLTVMVDKVNRYVLLKLPG